MTNKSSVEEIRERFDRDVERFANFETGQTAAMDSPLAMRLIAEIAAAVTPHARDVLDVGCGAGNYALSLLQHLPQASVTLIDLSEPMLQKAVERVAPQTTGAVQALQGDIREVELGSEQFDIIVAASVLHHLRADHEWQAVFAKFYQALRPGGAVWIYDLVDSAPAPVSGVMQARYGEYLQSLGGAGYREKVFAYIDAEDTPRSLGFQLALLAECGFAGTEVLHRNACFAAFGGWKSL